MDNRYHKKSIQGFVLRNLSKYEYLTGEEMIPPGRSQIVQQAKSIHSLLGKAFEKQTEKQVDGLKSLELPNNINQLKQINNVFAKKPGE